MRSIDIDDLIDTEIAAIQQERRSAEIAVAFSGGMDSTALLLATKRACDRRSADIVAIHVNHLLHRSAADWERHCVAIARQIGVRVEVIRVRIAQRPSVSVEMAARNARRAVLQRARADLVLVGHHAGDLAETMMLNIVRGCGAKGLAGMPQRSGKVVRPLLSVPKEALRRYVGQFPVTWIEDPSNLDAHFSRNFFRLEVLPAIVRRFPSAERAIGRVAANFANHRSAMVDLARIDAGGSQTTFPIAWRRMAVLGRVRQANLIREALAQQGYDAPNRQRLLEFLRQANRTEDYKSVLVVNSDWNLVRSEGWLMLAPRIRGRDK